MSKKEFLVSLIDDNGLIKFFRDKVKGVNSKFSYESDDYSHYIEEDNNNFISLDKTGEIQFDNEESLIILKSEVEKELTSKSSKKKQYDIAKKVLKDEIFDAVILITYTHPKSAKQLADSPLHFSASQKEGNYKNNNGNFRFSLITKNYIGTKSEFNSFKRYTYFIDINKPNKTFINQIEKADFSSVDKVKEAFSIEALTKEFYDEFEPIFKKLLDSVNIPDNQVKENFALLFIIRVIFIGFVQKRRWLGDSESFLLDSWIDYKEKYNGNDNFYNDYLCPLFFEAFNTPPNTKIQYKNNNFSEKFEKILFNTPYLNGGLFKKHNEDKIFGNFKLFISDKGIEDFFNFLFRYNFTIEENNRYDEELELNPEFLGIIFERLINKKDGAVYTPRIEVDMMCRLSIAKWLQKNSKIETSDIFRFIFKEIGDEDDQKHGEFSKKEIIELYNLIYNITIIDPASGSGAFPVGMMLVINELLEDLATRNNTPEKIKRKTTFDRKKDIIAKSLYGVEVREHAVWINQLRLWLSLFIDMPDNYKDSKEPLLPNLSFKIRRGDSIVQKVGTEIFPIRKRDRKGLQEQTNFLKEKKIDFFYNNKSKTTEIELKKLEDDLFKEIINQKIIKVEKEIKGIDINITEHKTLFAFNDTEKEEKSRNKNTKNKKDSKIKTLKKELDILKGQLESTSSRPLLWGEEVNVTENWLEIEKANEITKNDSFRVYPISHKKLKEEGSEIEEKESKKGKITKTEKYIGEKWGGKYLRAPDIFFTILEKGKGKLVKLGDIAEIRFGIKTGANDFFYLTPINPLSAPIFKVV